MFQPVEPTQPGVKWATRLPASDFWKACITNNYVLVQTSTHIASFDRKTGAKKWARAGRFGSYIVPFGDLALTDLPVSDADKQRDVVAIDAATGNERWRLRLAGPADFPPVVQGKLFLSVLARYESDVTAIDAASGKKVWVTTIPQPFSTVRAVSSRVVVVSTDGFRGGDMGMGSLLTGFNPETGRILWQKTDSDFLRWRLTMAAEGDTFYMYYGDHVEALRASNGALLWTGKPSKGKKGSGPIHAAGARVVVGHEDTGVISVFNRATGALLSEVPTARAVNPLWSSCFPESVTTEGRVGLLLEDGLWAMQDSGTTMQKTLPIRYKSGFWASGDLACYATVDSTLLCLNW